MEDRSTGTISRVEKRRSNWDKPGSLDDYLTGLCLTSTVGDIVRMRENSANMRALFCANLIFNAIFDNDIGAINQIVNRIDGAIPDKKNRDNYANLMGQAIEDVLDYPKAEQVCIYPDDWTIIGLAKRVIQTSCQEVGKNPIAKKERNQAAEMVLNRTGGRRSEPVREQHLIEYVQPDWMAPLPCGESEE